MAAQLIGRALQSTIVEQGTAAMHYRSGPLQSKARLRCIGRNIKDGRMHAMQCGVVFVVEHAIRTSLRVERSETSQQIGATTADCKKQA